MDHHVKQAPVQGVTGLWGGTQGALMSGASSDPVYVDDVFSTYLYKGTGGSNTVNNGLDISGEGGLLWVKDRTSARNSMLFDTERGANYEFATQSTSASNNNSSLNQTFTSTGFTFNNSHADVNNSSDQYASWSFRKCSKFFDIQEYSSGSSNTSGSIGNPNFQVNHDLGCIPGMILIKRTNGSTNWFVWIRGKEGVLNTDGSLGDASALPISNVTSTYIKFAAGNGLYNDPHNYIAYLFGGGPSTASTAKVLKFDNDVDALEIASSSQFGTGTGAFTWEAWVKPASWGTYGALWTVTADGTGTDGGLLIAKEGGFKVKAAGGTNYLSLSNPPIGVWTHVAVCRSGSTIKAFYNGLEQKSNTCTESFASGKAYIGYQGSNSAAHFTGLISNVRWIKGTALYTSSFKPPTEPLTNVTNTKLLCCNSSTVTGSTVTPTTISQKSGSNITVAYAPDTPFDDPDGFAFGGDEDQNIISTGTYTGNGSATAPPIINIGWEPQWIMVKHLSGQDWVMVDSIRGMTVGSSETPHLRANSNNQEQSTSYYRIDISSANGFAPHTTDNGLNADGSDYVYIAFRRPDGYVGKPADAATDVFALDTGNGSTDGPTYDSGFPVDWGMRRIPSGGGGLDANFIFYERLLGLNYLQSPNTSAQATSSRAKWDLMTGFNHTDSSSYNGWMWKRHIGLDVVAFEGTNIAGLQVPHSLNAVPEMMILKNRDATENWAVYHKGLDGGTNPEQHAIRLNSDAAEIDSDGFWNDTAPTATAFTVGNNGEANGFEMSMLAILFTSVTGISKVGSYTGDDTDDGSHEINVGFSPRFLVIKRADNTADWKVYNTLTGFPTSGSAAYMEFNTTDDAHSGGATVTRSTNGFKLYSPGGPYNANNGKYIYYAHA